MQFALRTLHSAIRLIKSLWLFIPFTKFDFYYGRYVFECRAFICVPRIYSLNLFAIWFFFSPQSVSLTVWLKRRILLVRCVCRNGKVWKCSMSFLIARIRCKCAPNQEYECGDVVQQRRRRRRRWHSTHPKPASNKFMFTIIKNRNVEIFINCAVCGVLAKWNGKGLTMCRTFLALLETSLIFIYDGSTRCYGLCIASLSDSGHKVQRAQYLQRK